MELVHRCLDISPQDDGMYYPDQPWTQHITTRRATQSLAHRVLPDAGQPTHISAISARIQELAEGVIPENYQMEPAIRALYNETNLLTWNGNSTYGLTEWGYTIATRNHRIGRRRSIADVAAEFLRQQGPAHISEITTFITANHAVLPESVHAAIYVNRGDRFRREPSGFV